MDKRILAVLEPQEEYAELFLRFITEKKDNVFDIRLFTQAETLLEFKKEHKIAVLLLSEHSEEKRVEEGIPLVIRLSEERCVQEMEKRPVIYKFQSGEQILKEVLEIYLEQGEDTDIRYLSNGNRHCRKIGVFSPFGGSGKTSMAAILGNLLGKEQKVLVLNLEPFYKEYSWLENRETDGISQLFYFFKQGRGDLKMKVQSLVETVGNMDYLRGVSNFLDLQKISAEEMQNFLCAVEENTEYDVLIFDISFLSEGLLALLRLCDVVYQPVDGRKKGDLWKKNFTKSGQELLEKKWKQVELLPEELGGEYGNITYLSQGGWAQRIKKTCVEFQKDDRR